VNTILPDFPTVAAPDASNKVPAEPELVVPELNLRYPDVPTVPASDVWILTAPLEYTDPAPVVMEIDPPVRLFVSPALLIILPP
jgi:hypothetical protein|tara:strand:- start:418 stop:669 length:252 start_codon:yes stop_codon:yes gene_type:complete